MDALRKENARLRMDNEMFKRLNDGFIELRRKFNLLVSQSECMVCDMSPMFYCQDCLSFICHCRTKGWKECLICGEVTCDECRSEKTGCKRCGMWYCCDSSVKCGSCEKSLGGCNECIDEAKDGKTTALCTSCNEWMCPGCMRGNVCTECSG